MRLSGVRICRAATAAAPALPLLTSRRHIDLLRVCSAAGATV
jgi:hypothetical protein